MGRGNFHHTLFNLHKKQQDRNINNNTMNKETKINHNNWTTSNKIKVYVKDEICNKIKAYLRTKTKKNYFQQMESIVQFQKAIQTSISHDSLKVLI